MMSGESSKEYYEILAEVHTQTGNRHRVKVSVISDGMYINGFIVYPPDDDHSDWRIYPPSTKAGKGYVRVIEFDMNGEHNILWNEIVAACIVAVEKWRVASEKIENAKPLYK